MDDVSGFLPTQVPAEASVRAGDGRAVVVAAVLLRKVPAHEAARAFRATAAALDRPRAPAGAGGPSRTAAAADAIISTIEIYDPARVPP